MFDHLKPERDDPILALIAAFRDDPRPAKIDLGVGVYRDADGRTPVMNAVKQAEKRIWERQDTKSYVALAGDPAFADAIRGLVLGDAVPAGRVAGAAAPGGTGALHLALQTVRRATPDVTIWLPRPTWPNHAALVDHVGLRRAEYRHYDSETGGFDRDGALADLSQLASGDVVVLHGCCHNPTGADPDESDWTALEDVIGRSGAVPLIDLAYLGFGDGIDADARATRRLVSALPEAFVAVSGSKSFGLYRDRAGMLLAVAANEAAAKTAQGALAHLNRVAYSFPPDHAGRIVTEILGTPDLEAAWLEELDRMRGRIQRLRSDLATALARTTNSDRFDAVARQRGMFSRLPLAPEAVADLRERHGVYMVGDGRINLAGLSEPQIPALAAAIAEVAR